MKIYAVLIVTPCSISFLEAFSTEKEAINCVQKYLSNPKRTCTMRVVALDIPISSKSIYKTYKMKDGKLVGW